MPTPKKISRNRRDFIRQGSFGIAGLTAAPYFFSSSKSAYGNALAENDKPNIGCIGVGSMGTGDAHDHANFGNIVAVCDVDSVHADRARQDERIGKGKAESYEDYRRVLDRKDIDVVSIVTPDHWHTKIAIEALQAGKHVFCQKPLTLTLEENRLIRSACKAHPDLVFVVGTQQRSDSRLFLRAVNMAQKGLLGKLTKLTIGINGSPTGGPFEPTASPAHLNWDMWLGQADAVPYMERRCHYEFRWWYEYSGGKFTDWGAHHCDIALWAAGLTEAGTGLIEIDGTDAKHPVEFRDGFPTVDNYYNTSHDFSIKHTFADGLEMIVDSRSDNGILIEGTKGRIFVNREKITGKPIEEEWDKGQYTPDDIANLYKGKPHEWHKANFYRCIREGGLPVSDVYSHLQAMNMCHTSAIAARLNRKLKWDSSTESFVGDEQANAMISRKPRTGFEIPVVG